MVVGQKHLIDEEGLIYTSLTNTFKIPDLHIVNAYTQNLRLDGSDYKRKRVVETEAKEENLYNNT